MDVQLLAARVEADERVCAIVGVVMRSVCITVIWIFYVGVRMLMWVWMVVISLRKEEKVLLLLSMKSGFPENLNLVGRDLTPRQSNRLNVFLSNIALLWIIKCWVELYSEPLIDIKIILIRLIHHVYHRFRDFNKILLFFDCILSSGASVAGGEDWKDGSSLVLIVLFRIMMVVMKLRLLRYALEWLCKKINLFIATDSHFLDLMIIVLRWVAKCWVSQSHR